MREIEWVGTCSSFFVPFSNFIPAHNICVQCAHAKLPRCCTQLLQTLTEDIVFEKSLTIIDRNHDSNGKVKGRFTAVSDKKTEIVTQYEYK